MDPKTKKVVFSHDVVFDEVSSYKFDAIEGKNTIDLPLFSNDSAFRLGESNVPLLEENIKQDELIESVL